MPLIVRLALPLLLAIGVIAWGSTPLVETLTARWFLNDVEMRSRLVFHSIQETVVDLIAHPDDRKLNDLFQRITRDKRVLAIGLCTLDGKLATHSPTWPRPLACPINSGKPQTFTVENLTEGSILVSSFHLADPRSGATWNLVVLHDLRFIERRSDSAALYLTALLTLLGLGTAATTAFIAKLTLRGWIRSARKGLTQNEHEAPVAAPELAPLIGDIRKLLRESDASHGLADMIRTNWTPDSLRQMLRDELPEVEILVLSNREPYIHNLEQDKIVLQRPASGLVTALEPIMRACGGTWVAHGSGQADRMTVDAADHLRAPPHNPNYTLRRVWLSDIEQNGYYYGFANEGLWPLCHIVFVRPVFRASDWEQYVAVNRKFADTVIAEAKTPDPIVLVQDYHFALAPRMIRESLPDATIITFWHIPWPNPEVFSICPWKEEILHGLLGSSILGFHTQFHCLNFIDSVDRFHESHIDREHTTVRAGTGTTQVRPYPISIEWPPAALAGQPAIAECRAQVRERFGLDEHLRIAIGVERFDYTKGIADRFHAVESLLEQHPQWIGSFTLIQIAAPTRSSLDSYRQTQKEATAAAHAVNDRFGRDGWRPIILVPTHHDPEQIFTLFRAADVCLVSSLHDGMNLVAKEFIAARDDEDGVLVLSTFAGASRELQEALIVNPYDNRAMGEALHTALSMPAEQRRERIRLMRDMISEWNIHHWAGRMLQDAARIRKRQHIERRIICVERIIADEQQKESME